MAEHKSPKRRRHSARKSPRKSPKKNCTLKQLSKAVFSINASKIHSGYTVGLIVGKNMDFIRILKASITKQECLQIIKNPSSKNSIEIIEYVGFAFYNRVYLGNSGY